MAGPTMSTMPPPPTMTDETPELDVDCITVPGQLYVVLSFVGPTGTNQKNDRFGIKVRGAFATQEEAMSHVRRLQRVDRTMDIFVAEMYKWLLIPPDVNAIENQEYQEEYLNTLIKGYRESQEMAKQVFEERKDKVKREGLDKHLLEHERLPPPPPDAKTSVDMALFETDDPLMARKKAEDAEAKPAEDAEAKPAEDAEAKPDVNMEDVDPLPSDEQPQPPSLVRDSAVDLV